MEQTAFSGDLGAGDSRTTAYASLFRQTLRRSGDELRNAMEGLERIICTVRTAKHRVFSFIPSFSIPESALVVIGSDDPLYLGLLSSRFHNLWAANTCSTLEDRPRYIHNLCFDTFPFPYFSATNPNDSLWQLATRIRDLAERLDGHRKRQQGLYPGLTLTDCYNVLEKLRAGTALTPKEKRVHDEGLVTVLLQLHNELDTAVVEAYGWPADLSDEDILTRLVDLNRERAAEEAQGVVRWLRPEYQNPATKAEAATSQADMLPEDATAKPAKPRKGADKPKPAKSEKLPWPTSLPERAKAVQSIMREQEGMTAQEVAERFKGAKAAWMEPIMETLLALGQVQ